MTQQTTSPVPAVTTPKLVDLSHSLYSFLLELDDLLNYEPTKTLYLDLEGVKLSRNGTLSLLTLLIHGSPEPRPIFLIDVHALGSSAFTTAPIKTPLARKVLSLKEILESRSTTKVFFDVRNDADALYSHLSVKLRGAVDV
jgi:exonuclease 3'-5' domain-containing protein 1